MYAPKIRWFGFFVLRAYQPSWRMLLGLEDWNAIILFSRVSTWWVSLPNDFFLPDISLDILNPDLINVLICLSRQFCFAFVSC